MEQMCRDVVGSRSWETHLQACTLEARPEEASLLIGLGRRHWSGALLGRSLRGGGFLGRHDVEFESGWGGGDEGKEKGWRGKGLVW